MKEFYIAPEAELICFAPIEELASDWDAQTSIFKSGNAVTSVEIPNPLPSDPENGDID